MFEHVTASQCANITVCESAQCQGYSLSRMMYIKMMMVTVTSYISDDVRQIYITDLIQGLSGIWDVICISVVVVVYGREKENTTYPNNSIY